MDVRLTTPMGLFNLAFGLMLALEIVLAVLLIAAYFGVGP